MEKTSGGQLVLEHREELVKARQLAHEGNIITALTLYDSVLKENASLGLEEEIEAKLGQAFAYYLQGDHDLSFRRVSGVMRTLDTLKHQKLAFLGFLGLSFVARGLMKRDLSEKSANNALELARDLGDDNLSMAFAALAWSLYSKNYYESALEYTRFASSLNKSVLTDSLLEECQAMCYFYLGNPKAALEHLSSVQFKREKHNLRSWLPQVYNYFGLVSTDLGRFNESQQWFDKAKASSHEIGNLRMQALVSNNLGDLERRRGDFRVARDHLLHSISVQEKYKPAGTLPGTTRATLAEIYLETGDLKQARKWVTEALGYLDEYEGSRQRNNALIVLGLVEGNSGNYQQAIDILGTAVDSFRKSDDRISLFQAISNLARIEHSAGEFERAFTHYKQCEAIASQSQVKANYIPTMANFVILLLDIGEEDEVSRLLRSLRREIQNQDYTDYDKAYLRMSEGAYELEVDNLSIAQEKLEEAHQIFEQLGSTPALVRVKVYNAEMNLKRYLLHKLNRYYKDSTTSIDEAIDLARQGLLEGLLAEILLVRAEMYSSRLNFSEGITLTEEASAIASRLGLQSITDRASLQARLLKERELTAKSVGVAGLRELFMDAATVEVFNKLRLAGGRTIQNDLDPENLYLSIFKTADIGAAIVLSDELPIGEGQDVGEYVQTGLLLSMGTVYITALGQGDRYNTGLFGPLPFIGDQEYAVLIYAVMLNDRQQTDKRMGDFSYCLFCLTFPKNLNPDRVAIETTFDTYFEERPDLDITDFGPTELEDLRKMVLDQPPDNEGSVTNGS